MRPFAFISYRREDAAAAARWIGRVCGDTFGPLSVFIDREDIRGGETWTNRIDKAIARTTLMLVIIGPRWMQPVAAPGGPRRPDNQDWVRREVVAAIRNKAHVVPILLDDVSLPAAQQLPAVLRPMLRTQAMRLHDQTWESDVERLIEMLASFGFRRQPGNIDYPQPRLTIRDLSDEEKQAFERAHPGWLFVSTRQPGVRGKYRAELYRKFEFRTFKQAIRFMSLASAHIDRVDHHPRWQNIWRTVEVWLSTWDIGHRPSQLDTDLAVCLDELAQDVQSGGRNRVERG